MKASKTDSGLGRTGTKNSGAHPNVLPPPGGGGGYGGGYGCYLGDLGGYGNYNGDSIFDFPSSDSGVYVQPGDYIKATQNIDSGSSGQAQLHTSNGDTVTGIIDLVVGLGNIAVGTTALIMTDGLAELGGASVEIAFGTQEALKGAAILFPGKIHGGYPESSPNHVAPTEMQHGLEIA